MESKTFPWNGPTIAGKFPRNEADVYGWQDTVTVAIDDGSDYAQLTLTFDGARALAAQLVAAADHAEGRA